MAAAKIPPARQSKMRALLPKGGAAMGMISDIPKSRINASIRHNGINAIAAATIIAAMKGKRYCFGNVSVHVFLSLFFFNIIMHLLLWNAVSTRLFWVCKIFHRLKKAIFLKFLAGNGKYPDNNRYFCPNRALALYIGVRFSCVYPNRLCWQ